MDKRQWVNFLGQSLGTKVCLIVEVLDPDICQYCIRYRSGIGR